MEQYAHARESGFLYTLYVLFGHIREVFGVHKRKVVRHAYTATEKRIKG